MSPLARPAIQVPRLPVLAYHDIGGGESPLSVSPERFAAQMVSLRDEGWSCLTLDGMLSGLRAGAWPARSVAVTFDDALVSVATHAVPVLARLGWPAVVFAVSGRVGAQADWPGWPAGLDGRLMDRVALRDAVAAGVEIGAHSVSHTRLSRLSAADAEREIVESRAQLEDLLGCPVRSFAYPYGDVTPHAVETVARHFEAGFGIDLGYVTGSSRADTLERIDAYYLRGRSRLTGLHDPGTRAYLALRGAVRQVRRRMGFGYGAGRAVRRNRPGNGVGS